LGFCVICVNPDQDVTFMFNNVILRRKLIWHRGFDRTNGVGAKLVMFDTTHVTYIFDLQEQRLNQHNSSDKALPWATHNGSKVSNLDAILKWFGITGVAIQPVVLNDV